MRRELEKGRCCINNAFVTLYSSHVVHVAFLIVATNVLWLVLAVQYGQSSGPPTLTLPRGSVFFSHETNLTAGLPIVELAKLSEPRKGVYLGGYTTRKRGCYIILLCFLDGYPLESLDHAGPCEVWLSLLLNSRSAKQINNLLNHRVSEACTITVIASGRDNGSWGCGVMGGL